MEQAQRIAGVEEDKAPLWIQPLFAATKKIVGRVTGSIKVQARRPGIAWFGNLAGLAIEKSGKVERRIHVFAQFRAAQIVECAACVDIIPALGKKGNFVTEAELQDVANWRHSTILSERERTAIEYAEAVTQTPVRVADELFARLKKHFNDDQIVELTAGIAFENYRARFNRALLIPGDKLND
jgi:Na+-translocating ferredoxin:NAD+ oxidoreductase RnfC subunit